MFSTAACALPLFLYTLVNTHTLTYWHDVPTFQEKKTEKEGLMYLSGFGFSNTAALYRGIKLFRHPRSMKLIHVT